MKKSLLTGALALAAVAVSAQPFAEGNPFSARKFGAKLTTSPSTQAKKVAKADTKDKENYYLRPEGSLFLSSDKKGDIWGPVYMVVPGATDLNFKKVTTGGQTFWHQNIYNWYDECTSYDRTGESGDSYYTDADGNFHINMTFDGGNVIPTLTWATDSFTLGEENPYWAPNTQENSLAFMRYYPQVFSGIDVANRRIQPLSYTDDHVSEVYFGGMDNHYTYGSGTYTGKQTYTATGVYQYFEKPMAPLYVEDIYLPAISQGYYPIAKGKEIKMQIHDVMEVNGQRIPGDKILYELTATEPEVLDVGSLDYDELTSYNAFNVVFTKKNAEGKAEPFVIDQPFYVVVYGLDGEGIDCGFEASILPKWYGNSDSAIGIWKDANNQPQYFDLYGSQPTMLKVTFTGKFDYVNPVYYGENQNYGIVKMSDDGNTGETIVEKSDVYPGAMLKVNGDWYDADGNANYEVKGMPSWVKSVSIDTDSYASYEVVLATFKCEPLPAGVNGRKCSLYVEGVSGVKSTFPIELLQGDATPTGINNVTVKVDAEGNTYNVAGQRVNADAKGLVIRGGKKYLNK